jgi:glutathione S-transferase
MALVLYHNPISTCSQKVRLALAEKRLSFESHVINFDRQEHLSEWYLRLNPNGVVPTPVHDERPIVDSSVICEYLDEVFPDPALAPAGAFERAQMRAWMRYFEEVPTVAIRIPSCDGGRHALTVAIAAELSVTAGLVVHKKSGSF